jgi:cobalt-zinc-cadmium efflux system membrane fusion protein
MEVYNMNKKSLTHLSIGLVVGVLIGAIVFGVLYQPAVGGSRTSLALPISALAVSSGDTSAKVATAIEGKTDWCVEHRVPESECTKCNPSLIPAFKAKGDWCNEHQLPESHDRICHPGLTFAQEPKVESLPDESYKPSVYFPKNDAHCETDDAVIQFASAETAERVGLTVVPALEIKEADAAEAPAEALFDETRSYVITTTVPALVVRWLVEPGQSVAAGQALAELESPDMPRLKADYLEASADAQVKEQEHSRADSLSKRGLISTAEAQQAYGQLRAVQARLSGARGLLEACGLTPDDIQVIQSSGTVTPRWLLRAIKSGALLERKATLGEHLAAGSSLALVGDPSVLWIEAHVRESDLSLFHKGQSVVFASDGDALEKVGGRVIWVAQYIDPLTRSATVRAQVTNASLDLKAHQFGRIMLPASATPEAVAVPRDAVQWEGCCNVVFVKEAPDRYRPHKVSVSRGERGYYNINSGLHAGDMVVVNGSYLLKTELKKGSLGAGCCDVAPKS